MGVFYIGDIEGMCGVFRRLCVGMIIGWDFYWFGVGRGCDVLLCDCVWVCVYVGGVVDVVECGLFF